MNYRTKSVFSAVKAALSPATTEALLHRLAPGGRRNGAEYVALSPIRSDRHVGSFKFNVHKGVGADFATGWKGDLIDLAAEVSGISKLEAAKQLANMLGVEA